MSLTETTRSDERHDEIAAIRGAARSVLPAPSELLQQNRDATAVRCGVTVVTPNEDIWPNTRPQRMSRLCTGQTAVSGGHPDAAQRDGRVLDVAHGAGPRAPQELEAFMNRIAALALVTASVLAACWSAAAPTPQIVYVTPQPTVAASPTATPVPPATPSPSPSPRPSPIPIRDAAASRFVVIETAYVKAYTALRTKTFGASDQWASYAQARSYYRAEARNLERFDSNLRKMTFPADVMPDVRVLLRRISELVILMEDLAGRDSASYGWQLNEQILKASNVMDAARVVVGKDLGLTYGN